MTVLQFKQRPVKGTQPRKIPDENRWECVNCNSQLFQLLSSGDIYCDGCKLKIDRLTVVRS